MLKFTLVECGRIAKYGKHRYPKNIFEKSFYKNDMRNSVLVKLKI